MSKYRVFLKSGTILDIEADMVTSNEAFFHFFSKEPVRTLGSFSVPEVFGFYEADQVKKSTDSVRPMNPVG